MLKKFLSLMVMLYAVACLAAVDVNKASVAELDSIKGIGPAISGKILDERKKGNFKDWADLVDRVKGVGKVNAAKFSDQGLTVNGEPFKTTGTSTPTGKVVKKTEVKEATSASSAAKK